MRPLQILVLCQVLLTSSAVRADARAPDGMATTWGSTTLLQPTGKAATRPTATVTIALFGDHATIEERVQGTANTELELLAPDVKREEEAEELRVIPRLDSEPWPGGLTQGEFPSFVATGDRLLRLKVARSWTRAPVARWVPVQGEGERSLELTDSDVAVRRLAFSAADNQSIRAVWTVPYYGDTYGGKGALDCSCGEPWNFELQMSGLVMDLTKSLPAVIQVANKLKSAVRIRQGTAEFVVPPSELRTFALEVNAPGSQRLLRQPATIGLGQSLYCRSPQEDEGEEGYDQGEEYQARREQQLASDHRALRWEARCRVSGKDVPPRRAPRFIRLDGSEKAWARRDRFIRGFARELLAAPPVAALQDGTFLRSARPLRLMPDKPARVTASSTLEAASPRYQPANLVDGNAATAWCEGSGTGGKGAAVQVEFQKPARLAGVGLLPGYVKTDWLYEANAAPRRIRMVAKLAAGERQVEQTLALPSSAELFAEGQDALFLPLTAEGVRALSLVVEEVREGKFTKDLCISEVLLLE